MNNIALLGALLGASQGKSLDEKLNQVQLLTPRSGQSGVSGKTIFHHKFKAGKKPQGKFTSMK